MAMKIKWEDEFEAVTHAWDKTSKHSKSVVAVTELMSVQHFLHCRHGVLSGSVL